MTSDLVEKTATHIRQLQEGEGSGHDWWHTYRVWKMAVRIAKEENADLLTVELAALLHDIADYKLNNNDETLGPLRARQWLASINATEAIISHICQIIEAMGFKGALVDTGMKTLEGKIVQDADRLDALGAIGIARAFVYGGHKGQVLHDPDLKPHMHKSFEEYKSIKTSSINHFYEKLLLLKDRMNTASGKRIAAERHKFMQDYLGRFYEEWEGKL